MLILGLAEGFLVAYILQALTWDAVFYNGFYNLFGRNLSAEGYLLLMLILGVLGRSSSVRIGGKS